MGRFFKPPPLQHRGFSTTTRNNSTTTNLVWITEVNSIGSSLCFNSLKFAKPTPLNGKLLQDYLLYVKLTFKTDVYL